MKLDRALQKRILIGLAGTYPAGTYDVAKTLHPEVVEEVTLIRTLQYLDEHGLVSNGFKLQSLLSGDDSWLEQNRTNITAKGLDFIANDGGLGAILNTVTVRIDASQWAELLASKVESLESISHDERSEIAKVIRNLPAAAIGKVSARMLDWAVDHAGDALPLLRTLLSQVAV